MLMITETTNRYHITIDDAKKLLDQIENHFAMDWSEMSWAQIDKRVKATMKILGIKVTKAGTK